MPANVFANGGGLFHKGSMGKGIAFPDVCLTPPPPPAGPVPVPYPNVAMASDLAQGSTSVKIQGKPTALKNSSYCSTSTGDEAGTQGGNVVTHKTKGKAYFMFWSLDVKIEGKNVDRDGDPMAQNCATPPMGACCMRSSVVRAAVKAAEAASPPCPRPYNDSDRHGTPNTAQKRHVAKKNGRKFPRCWKCKRPTKNPIADHQPPCVVAYYSGLCHDPKKMEEFAKSTKSVKPHCHKCSPSQGGAMKKYSKILRGAHGF